MAETLHSANPILSDIIPEKEVEKLEIGRVEEILQPLKDLGYIKAADELLLPIGIRLFRKDYLSLNLIPEFAPNFVSLSLTELEGEELSLLHTLTALDGDFLVETLPSIGEVNLCSRIIHYRLNIHHLYHDSIDSPFSQKSLEALKKLREWIHNLPPTPLGLINLIGDIPILIRHININSNGKLNKKIVAFEYHKSTDTSPFKVEIPKENFVEIAEDPNDPEKENEAEVLKERLKIEHEIDVLNENEIFDQAEQDALKDSKKTKRKRAQLIRVDKMIDMVRKKQIALNESINQRSDAITASLNSLNIVKASLQKDHDDLATSIEKIDAQISQFSEGQNKLDNKERQLKRKQKRQKNRFKQKRQDEIDSLVKEISALKNKRKKIEPLQLEKSTLNVKLFPITEQLNKTNKSLEAFNKKMKVLIEERNTVMSKKENELVKLLDELMRLERKINRLKFSFKGRLKRVLDRDYYDDVVKPVFFVNRNKRKLKDFADDPYNNYLIRLIQIFQWTNGFYYGKLDNAVGDRTFSALNDMVTYSKGLRLKFILSRLSEDHTGIKGYWVLNVKYLFMKLSDILKKMDPDTTTEDLLEAYENEITDDQSKKARIGNETTDRAYEEIVNENQEDIKKRGVVRRIYYGIKSIASTLINSLKEIFKILKKGIKKLIYLAKNLIKIVYKEIREGVRKFKDGMKFLFGKRQFITPTSNGAAILTKFDFDFDVLSFAPANVKEAELLSHVRHLYRFSNNLDFSLVLTAKILKWVFKFISAGTPLGWARLALKIALQYKKMVIKWLITIGRKLTHKIISIKYKVKEARA